MASQIGPFTFADLSAPPELVQQQMIARTRPGTNGVLVQALGVKATPFQVNSDAKAVNRTAAENLYYGADGYRSLVGAPAVGVTWANLPLFLAGHRFFVMAVHPVSIQNVMSGVGPDGDFAAEIQCRWTLQPVTLSNQ